MTKTTRWACSVAVALTVVGCKKEEPAPERAASPPAPSPVAATTAKVEAEGPAEADAIPTEEDFEEEAATTITPENLEDELDKLEQEIEAE